MLTLCTSGGNQTLHGPRGVGGSHQLPARCFPPDRHVCGGTGAVGAGGPLHCIWWYEDMSCYSSLTNLTSNCAVISAILLKSDWHLSCNWSGSTPWSHKHIFQYVLLSLGLLNKPVTVSGVSWLLSIIGVWSNGTILIRCGKWSRPQGLLWQRSSFVTTSLSTVHDGIERMIECDGRSSG